MRGDLLGEAAHLRLEGWNCSMNSSSPRVEGADPLGDRRVAAHQPGRRAAVGPDMAGGSRVGLGEHHARRIRAGAGVGAEIRVAMGEGEEPGVLASASASDSRAITKAERP